MCCQERDADPENPEKSDHIDLLLGTA